MLQCYESKISFNQKKEKKKKQERFKQEKKLHPSLKNSSLQPLSFLTKITQRRKTRFPKRWQSFISLGSSKGLRNRSLISPIRARLRGEQSYDISGGTKAGTKGWLELLRDTLFNRRPIERALLGSVTQWPVGRLLSPWREEKDGHPTIEISACSCLSLLLASNHHVAEPPQRGATLGKTKWNRVQVVLESRSTLESYRVRSQCPSVSTDNRVHLAFQFYSSVIPTFFFFFFYFQFQ